jgi:hypothetical protein
MRRPHELAYLVDLEAPLSIAWPLHTDATNRLQWQTDIAAAPADKNEVPTAAGRSADDLRAMLTNVTLTTLSRAVAPHGWVQKQVENLTVPVP